MKSGEIANAQISASSELNRIHAAILGRLESRVVGDKRGSWVAPPEDLSPWLQIDLLRQDTKITLIATQGRYDAAHWITKYSLLYSNDTSDFIYYKEQGQQNANKVGWSDRETTENVVKYIMTNAFEYAGASPLLNLFMWPALTAPCILFLNSIIKQSPYLSRTAGVSRPEIVVQPDRYELKYK